MKLIKQSRLLAALSAIAITVVAIPSINTMADDEIINDELNPTYYAAQKILEENKELIDLNYEDTLAKVNQQLDNEEIIQDRLFSIFETTNIDTCMENASSINLADSSDINDKEEPIPNKVYIGTYELTAYIATGNPCASGVYPTVNHTVACNSLPMGTKIYIEGLGEFVVEDTGGMADNVIDIFVSDYTTAINFGRQIGEVYIIE